MAHFKYPFTLDIFAFLAVLILFNFSRYLFLSDRIEIVDRPNKLLSISRIPFSSDVLVLYVGIL